MTNEQDISQEPLSKFTDSSDMLADNTTNRQTCPTCESPLAPDVGNCPNCGHSVSDKVSTLQTSTSNSGISWSLNRVIFATVTARTRTAAIPQAEGIFKIRTGGDHRRATASDTYDLVDDVDVASSVTNAWGDLPGAVNLATPDGQDIVEKIAENLENAASARYTSPDRQHLYGEYGGDLSTDDLRALDPASLDDGEEFWIIPALAYMVKREMPDSAQEIFCAECGETTSHTFHGHDGAPEKVKNIARNGSQRSATSRPDGSKPTPSVGNPVWMCWECNTPRFGPEADEAKNTQNTDTGQTDGVDEITAEDFPKKERGPQDAHEYFLQQLEDQGRNVPQTTENESDDETSSDGTTPE